LCNITQGFKWDSKKQILNSLFFLNFKPKVYWEVTLFPTHPFISIQFPLAYHQPIVHLVKELTKHKTVQGADVDSFKIPETKFSTFQHALPDRPGEVRLLRSAQDMHQVLQQEVSEGRKSRNSRIQAAGSLAQVWTSGSFRNPG